MSEFLVIEGAGDGYLDAPFGLCRERVILQVCMCICAPCVHIHELVCVCVVVYLV
jgi:hypothetical protein